MEKQSIEVENKENLKQVPKNINQQQDKLDKHDDTKTTNKKDEKLKHGKFI
jgi:hypothetical protein